LTWTLVALECSQVQKLQRLSDAERALASTVRQKRTEHGMSTIRHLEGERQKIGRELHTGVGQMLVAIKMQSEVVAAHLADPPQPVRQAVDRIATLADEALEQVRSVSRRLHPPQWQQLPLDTAIRRLWDMTGVADRFEHDLRLHAPRFDPGVEIKSLFYRAAQEALSNIVRHSKATRIQLILDNVREKVVLQVRDNGVGFDARKALSRLPGGSGGGIGLLSLREQARAIGAKLLIKSGRVGTTLELSLVCTPGSS
jgi:signal transduction histidine kinase